MAIVWSDVQQLISKLADCFTVDKKFVTGECNCDNCVHERLKESLGSKYSELYEYFPESLYINTLEHSSISRISHTLKISPDHKSKEEVILGIFNWVAKENPLREKRIPIKKQTTCSCCGLYLNKTKCYHYNFSHGEEPLCAKCAAAFNQCSHCKKFVSESNINGVRVVDVNGENAHLQICRSCLDTEFVQCEFCGGLHLRNESSTISLDGRKSRDICTHCRVTYVKVCEDCGSELYHNPKSPRFRASSPSIPGHHGPREDDVVLADKLLCNDCVAYAFPINSFNFRPKPIFTIDEHTEKLTEKQRAAYLFFGTELEIERLAGCSVRNNKVMAKLLRSLWPSRLMYAVHDGSLETGFELVTQPFTWKRYLSDRKVWMDTFGEIDKYGYGTGPRAGQHIHMSKAAFSTMHLYKFVTFLYRKETRAFIEGIAERSMNSDIAKRYCKFESVDVENTLEIARRKDNLSQDKHHSAVNLENEGTVEIRIFKMPKNFDGFAKNMEFVYALYNFAKEEKIEDMIPERFVNYIFSKRNKNMYRNLCTFIKNHSKLNGKYPTFKENY